MRKQERHLRGDANDKSRRTRRHRTVSLKADRGLGSTTSADLLLSGGAIPLGWSTDVTSDRSANEKPPLAWLHASWVRSPPSPPPLPLPPPPLLLGLLALGCCCCEDDDDDEDAEDAVLWRRVVGDRIFALESRSSSRRRRGTNTL